MKSLTKFMVIETYNAEQLKDLYLRFESKGRMLPKGLHYLDSWINEDLSCCYQIMESDSIEKVKKWANQWNDLINFEIIPIISSETAMKIILKN